jgi:hypothetical protein
MSLRASALVAALVVLLAGCAESRSLVGSAPAAPTVVAVTAPIKYPNSGFDIEPPGAAVPKVDWTHAYATCSTGQSICVPGLTPTISLAKVTDNQSGAINPDGSIAPTLNGTLAWVITYIGAPCTAPAGPEPATSQNSTSTNQTCTIINFVSADTGAFLYAAQGANL